MSLTNTAVESGDAPTAYPPGALNANWFNLFNAVSWQIVLGAPTVLYAKSLGAPATVLGFIASLTPLLTVLQLPVAHLLPKYGYRRFMLAGWGSRTIFIFAVAAIPFMSFAPPWLRLSLLVFCLFVFNFLRGMASGAWLPWISELVPVTLRGRFLSRDQLFMQFGSLLTLTASAVVLFGRPQAWQFSLVFLISALGATVSLLYLNRIPDVTTAETMKRSGHRVPWKQMMLYPPFFRITLFNALYCIVSGGVATFTVSFLKGMANFPESWILYLTTLPVIGAIATVPFVGHFLDRNGSRLALRICLVGYSAVLLGWWAVAGKLTAPSVLTVAALNLAIGVANANFSVANSRLVMTTMPLMGRNHFFAMYTVITSLALGLSPILWGLLLDVIGQRAWQTAGVMWNRYSIYFAAALALGIINVLYSIFLHERKHEVHEMESSVIEEVE